MRLLEELERQLPVTAASIAAGIRDVRWPGRLQMIEVSGGRRVLLDAAHNPAGAWALASYLKREFPEPLPIVFGALRDKDVSLMLKALLPAASTMVMTEPATPRAYRAGELAAIARTLSPRAKLEVEPDPARALERAWTLLPGRVRSGIDLSRRQSACRPRRARARSVMHSSAEAGDCDRRRRMLFFESLLFSCSVCMINLLRGTLIADRVACRDAAVLPLAQLTDIPGFDKVLAQIQESLDGNRVLFREAVEMTQGDMKFYADFVEYYVDTNRMVATGNVLLIETDHQIAADRADFNAKTRLGTFYNARGFATLGAPPGRRQAHVGDGVRS